MRSIEEIRAMVPPALQEWIERRDPNEVPPAIDSGYNMRLQVNLINNEKRLRKNGVWDGTRPLKE